MNNFNFGQEAVKQPKAWVLLGAAMMHPLFWPVIGGGAFLLAGGVYLFSRKSEEDEVEEEEPHNDTLCSINGSSTV